MRDGYLLVFFEVGLQNDVWSIINTSNKTLFQTEKRQGATGFAIKRTDLERGYFEVGGTLPACLLHEMKGEVKCSGIFIAPLQTIQCNKKLYNHIPSLKQRSVVKDRVEQIIEPLRLFCRKSCFKSPFSTFRFSISEPAVKVWIAKWKWSIFVVHNHQNLIIVCFQNCILVSNL